MCSLSLCSWVAQLTHKTYILKKVFEFNGTFPCPKSCLHKKWMTPKSDFGTALETVNEQSQLQVAFEQSFSREAPFLNWLSHGPTMRPQNVTPPKKMPKTGFNPGTSWSQAQ